MTILVDMRTKSNNITGAALLVASVFLVSLALAACSPRPKEVLLSGPTMGTEYHVKYIDEASTIDAELAEQAALDALNQVDNLMSTYKPESELSRFNARQDTEAIPLSPETLEVFKIALEIYGMSHGAFDVTVGPIVNAYGFGPDMKSTPPTDSELATLKQHVGCNLLHLDADAATLQKNDPKVYCDLSAVAKGYAVDQIADALEKLGVQNYMVEVGGEVRVQGKNVEGKAWRIAIEMPDSEQRMVYRIVSMGAGGLSPTLRAMATSGDYRNFFMEDGRRISHTIDPRTGKSITHNLASVSVLHESCAWADALATTLMVLGPEEGLQFAEEYNIAAYMLIRTKDGFESRKTPAFPDIDPQH